MKKFVAVLLCSALVAAPAFAADTARAAKPAKAGHKPAQWSAEAKDDCDSKHGKDGHHDHPMMDMMESHGMMGGHGMGDPYGYDKGGMGAMGGMMMAPDRHMLEGLELSDEQRAKITKLSDELRHNNWAAQGQINDETAKLRDLYQAEKRDPAAIGKEYQKVFDLKRQMIEAYLETENRIEDVLTPEQRAQMKAARSQVRHMYENRMMH